MSNVKCTQSVIVRSAQPDFISHNKKYVMNVEKGYIMFIRVSSLIKGAKIVY